MILADALNVDHAKCAADSAEDEIDWKLRETQMCDEWRLRRSAVLRWVRGWYDASRSPNYRRPRPPCHRSPLNRDPDLGDR